MSPLKTFSISVRPSIPYISPRWPDLSWRAVPLAAVAPLEGVGRRVYVLGDVHGELVGMREVLAGIGVIKKGSDLLGSQDRWRAGKSILVQGGDIIDRGDYPLESYQYLRRLQEQAADAGGQVRILMGNHEMLYLLKDKNNWGHLDDYVQQKIIKGINLNMWNQPQQYVDLLKSDIALERMEGVLYLGGKIFSHGVITSELLRPLESQLGLANESLNNPDYLRNAINLLFRKSFTGANRNSPHLPAGTDDLYDLDYGFACAYFSRVQPNLMSASPWDQVVFHDYSIFQTKNCIEPYVSADDRTRVIRQPWLAPVFGRDEERLYRRTIIPADIGLVKGFRAALGFDANGDAFALYPN